MRRAKVDCKKGSFCITGGSLIAEKCQPISPLPPIPERFSIT